jgi:hypothetical protein
MEQHFEFEKRRLPEGFSSKQMCMPCLGMKKAKEVKLFETLSTTKPVASARYKSKCSRKEDHPF